MFGLQMLSGPDVEPVTLAQAKLWLRTDFSDDDALITGLISAARTYCEKYMRRCIFSQQWLYSRDMFPMRVSQSGTRIPNNPMDWFGYSSYWTYSTIYLPRPTLQSVDKITYLDASGVSHTVDPTTYLVDVNGEPGRVFPKNGYYWPYPSTYVPGSVQVTFTTGSYGDGSDLTAVPASITQAMQLLISNWYDNRGDTSVPIPTAVNLLLEAHRFDCFDLG